MNTDVNRLLFYRGLLFGIRAEGVEAFPAQGPALSRAFESTLALAERLEEERDAGLLEFARVGVSPHAREMLHEGEDDAVLWLEEPEMRRARFAISAGDAEEGLEMVHAPELFRQLGRHFVEQLRHT